MNVTIGDREVYGRSDRGGYIDVVAHDHGLEPGWRQVVVEAQGTDPVPADVFIVGDDVTTGSSATSTTPSSRRCCRGR